MRERERCCTRKTTERTHNLTNIPKPKFSAVDLLASELAIGCDLSLS